MKHLPSASKYINNKNRNPRSRSHVYTWRELTNYQYLTHFLDPRKNIELYLTKVEQNYCIIPW